MNESKEMAALAAQEFFRIARLAAERGGFWVSSAGGTAHAVAGEIARATGVSFEDACAILDQQGDVAANLYGPEHYGYEGPFGWYEWLADIQPPVDLEDLRLDARAIARQAVRAARRRIDEVDMQHCAATRAPGVRG
jgi:hypothetical protein